MVRLTTCVKVPGCGNIQHVQAVVGHGVSLECKGDKVVRAVEEEAGEIKVRWLRILYVILMLQEEGPLPGPESGLLFNTQK